MHPTRSHPGDIDFEWYTNPIVNPDSFLLVELRKNYECSVQSK